ncbi:hypothetical protein LY76DRAFT_57334 [Colletotrichum caudatum]|nr:hypothetical protein LY76DRAFT_57334 [Colletotrichum caudatum]
MGSTYLVVRGSIEIPSINLSPLPSTQNIHLLACPSLSCGPAVSQPRSPRRCFHYYTLRSLPIPPSRPTRRRYERVMKTTRDPSLPTITPGFCPLLGPSVGHVYPRYRARGRMRKITRRHTLRMALA